MTVEQDTPPPANTFRRFIWDTISQVVWARAFWGRRLLGGAIGLIADSISEYANQAFYARLPGHPQQAPDSLEQSGITRDLFRFRGETKANYIARILASWDDYEQQGTAIQMLRVINQWGTAGWPVTWDPGLVTFDESGDPAVWTDELTIGFGAIDPPWTPWLIGGGETIGETGLYIGIGPSTDIAWLLYLVRKWKRSASKVHVKVYYSVSGFVTFTV